MITSYKSFCNEQRVLKKVYYETGVESMPYAFDVKDVRWSYGGIDLNMKTVMVPFIKYPDIVFVYLELGHSEAAKLNIRTSSSIKLFGALYQAMSCDTPHGLACFDPQRLTGNQMLDSLIKGEIAEYGDSSPEPKDEFYVYYNDSVINGKLETMEHMITFVGQGIRLTYGMPEYFLGLEFHEDDVDSSMRPYFETLLDGQKNATWGRWPLSQFGSDDNMDLVSKMVRNYYSIWRGEEMDTWQYSGDIEYYEVLLLGHPSSDLLQNKKGLTSQDLPAVDTLNAF